MNTTSPKTLPPIFAPAGGKLTAQSGKPQPAGTPSTTFLSGEVGRVLRRFKLELVWICIFSFFVNLLALTPTLYMLQVFDRVMLSGNGYTLLALTGLVVVFALTTAFAEWLRSRLLVRVGGRFDQELNRPALAAAFSAQLAQPSRSPQQPLTDLNTLRTFLTGNGVIAAMDVPWTVVFIGALFLMHPALGWLSVGFCAVQLTLGFVAQRLQLKQQSANQKLALEASQYLQAKLRNAETVEGMGMQGNLRAQWMALHDREMIGHRRLQEISRRVQAIVKWVQYTQQGLMLALGAILAINGKITSGAMVAANTLMGNALRPVGLLVAVWGQTVDAKAAYNRLNAALAALPATPTEVPAAQVLGQVSVRNLVATAPGRPAPILRGLTVDFRAGEVVGIIGPSGAGKSTFARCLLGIWPGAEGEVLIDGHAISLWPREALGPKLGYLPQDVELFDGTIAENISRFSDVDSVEIVQAATRAGIHDMVLRLPKGYDTPIGEAGAMLSGGQRQRLGLARALLGQPRILVMDEPTANLDDVGEAALIRAVRELKASGATIFMIVHQPHLLAVADRVLTLEAGQISKIATVTAPLAVSSPFGPSRS